MVVVLQPGYKKGLKVKPTGATEEAGKMISTV